MLLILFRCPLGEATPSRISQELRNLGSKRKILAKNPFPADSSRSFSSLEFLPIQPRAGSPKGTVVCRERPWMRPEFRETPSSRRAKPPLKGSKSSGKAGISPGYQSQELPSLSDSSQGGAGSGSFPFSSSFRLPALIYSRWICSKAGKAWSSSSRFSKAGRGLEAPNEVIIH